MLFADLSSRAHAFKRSTVAVPSWQEPGEGHYELSTFERDVTKHKGLIKPFSTEKLDQI